MVGEELKKYILVTGCIIAVMGTENAHGELEVIDLKFPDLAPQPERWALSQPATANGSNSKPKSKGNQDNEDVEMADSTRQGSGSKFAIVSGLEFSGTVSSYATELALLLEYLLGEALDPTAQTELAHISRLIIAGNSVAAERKATVGADEAPEGGSKKSHHKKYGYDASSYNPTPAKLFDDFLTELLPSIPVTLLPGVSDPANASYPQQPIHPAMFPHSRAYAPSPDATAQKEPGWLDAVTNPWEGELEGWRVLGTSGQNVDDVFKYVEGDDRLGMMEAMCRWRCAAPTAPDTLWAYPFQEDEPFVMRACPHLYFVGNQAAFGTRVITGDQGQMVRLVLVPRFAESKEVVLVDSETLDVTRVKIAA
jgi:DNA polymerase delta subunit 2